MQKTNSIVGIPLTPPPPHVAPSAAFGMGLAVMQARRGFALLITITLVAFLVLILVSLATLTRVETQVASNSQTQTKARQNALLALNIAIGQLQKFAGPDQRTTGTADLVANADRSGTAINQVGTATTVSGKQTVSAGARYWTGVWGNASDPSADSGQPRFLNWLVSGNEKVAVTATETGAQFGRITSAEPTGSNLPVKATDSINLSLTSLPTDNITIGTKSGRLLVGRHSAGSQAADLPSYIVAPAEDISVASSQIPGLAGNTPTTIGRYAYWVGDEGVKSRLNLANPWPVSGNTTSDDDERTWAFANAQRTAGDSMSGFSSLTDVEKLLDPGQVNFATTTLTPEDLGRRYHDYSLHSATVLADQRRGGLKRDLTRILESGGGSADEANNATIFPDLGSSGDPFFVRPATWGLLRDFAVYGTAAFSNLVPRTPSATQAGVSPTIMLARMDYSYTVDAPVASGSPGVPATQTWNAHISPFFILWNPYNRTLQGARYEIAVQGPRKTIGTDQGGVVQFSLTLPPAVVGDAPPPAQTMWLNLGNAHFEHPDYPPVGILPADWNTPTTDREFYRFTAVVPDLAPGQSVIIGINPVGQYDYTPGMQLNARSYLDRANYPNVARIRTHSLTINAADNVSVTVPQIRRVGEVNAYLGIEAAGADPAAANNNGSSNYYQWLGRVEVSTPAIIPEAPFGPFSQNIASGSSGNPPVVAAFNIWHQLGAANDYFTAPLQSRWIAAANPRAYMLNRTGLEFGGTNDLVVNPVYVGLLSAYSLNGGTVGLPLSIANAAAPGGSTEPRIGNDFNNTSFNPTFWPRPILFEFPESNQPLFSIANLQHAPVSGLITSPAYAVGNSLADFRVASGGLDKTSLAIGAGYLDPVGGADYGPRSEILYDQSYQLNQALWDRYFFSTVPAGAASLPDILPNSRHTYFHQGGALPTINDFLSDTEGSKAASLLLLSGGFNINSTSVEAWRAFLGSNADLLFNPLDPTDTSPSATDSPADTAAFSRFRRPRNSWQLLTANNAQNISNRYGGYRRLTDTELDGLAQRIVAEVRERGPFLSVAEFVNRSLTGPTDRTRLKGALQAALDDEANSTPTTRINFVAESSNTINGGGRHTVARTGGNGKNPDAYAPFDNVVAPYNTPAYVGYNTNALNTPVSPYTRNDAFLPGELTQADLLATLGSSLTARSDTFVVRAYGETVNPLTNQPESRAWCEAIVQRTPDYIKPDQDAPETKVDALTDTDNRRFGRRFKVISFRWLTADDI